MPIIDAADSPVWDDDSQSLNFVNPLTNASQSSIFRYSARDGTFYSAYIEGVFAPSFILPAKSKCKKCKNLFVVGVGSQVVTIKWNGKSPRAKVVRQLFTMDANIPSSRTGMAKASPKGRFFGVTYYYPMDCTKPTVLSYYRYDNLRIWFVSLANWVQLMGLHSMSRHEKCTI